MTEVKVFGAWDFLRVSQYQYSASVDELPAENILKTY